MSGVWFRFIHPKRVARTAFREISRAMSSSSTSEVLMEKVGNKGIITLNRPNALNALNLSMIRQIYPQLRAWEKEVSFIVIKGEGDKAFCAGGDIKAVTAAAKAGENAAKDFFREEYRLNYLIGNLEIPYVALIHGVTMGGGVGLSVHGNYRVATSSTIFAMPETAIGFFPDVGASYVLPKLEDNVGMFLALTGYRLTGRDVLTCGIATHYIEHSMLPALTKDLTKLTDAKRIPELLDSYTKESTGGKKAEFSLKPHLPKINKIFGARSLEEIFQLLQEDGSEWALKHLETLKKMSPTSLKITFKLLQEGKRYDLKHCLEMECRLAFTCLKNHDFYEGVRAVLVDRDNPKWQPSTVEEIAPNMVQTYFRHLPSNEALIL
ncbi:hypothetical protein CHUAL_011019 [Chamberlinius hualienensis]